MWKHGKSAVCIPLPCFAVGWLDPAPPPRTPGSAGFSVAPASATMRRRRARSAPGTGPAGKRWPAAHQGHGPFTRTKALLSPQVGKKRWLGWLVPEILLGKKLRSQKKRSKSHLNDVRPAIFFTQLSWTEVAPTEIHRFSCALVRKENSTER